MLGSAVEPVTTATRPVNGRSPPIEWRPCSASTGTPVSPMPPSVAHALALLGVTVTRIAASSMAFIRSGNTRARASKPWSGTTTATAFFGSFARANPIIQSSVFASGFRFVVPVVTVASRCDRTRPRRWCLGHRRQHEGGDRSDTTPAQP